MTCPHGRPTVLRYGMKDLQKAFKQEWRYQSSVGSYQYEHGSGLRRPRERPRQVAFRSEAKNLAPGFQRKIRARFLAVGG